MEELTINGENNQGGSQNSENPEYDVEIAQRREAIRRGKRPVSEIYEFKLLTSEEVLNKESDFANFEQGGTSQHDELKKEEGEGYDYDQDKAILKSMYHYYFNHGGVLPSPYSKELINYIEDLTPNLKIRGQALVNQILMLQHNLLTVWKMTGGYYYPEMIHPLWREIFDMSVCLWVDFRDYNPVKNVDENVRD